MEHYTKPEIFLIIMVALTFSFFGSMIFLVLDPLDVTENGKEFCERNNMKHVSGEKYCIDNNLVVHHFASFNDKYVFIKWSEP